MAKNTKTNTNEGLGDAELVMLSNGAQHAERLIEPVETLKPITRQRAAANLLKRELVVEQEARPGDPVWREDVSGRFSLVVTDAGLAAIGLGDGQGTASEPIAPAAPAEASAPRDGSKGALVVSMLTRPTGANIDELMSATGWLPRTTRAALTGLRKRGFTIDRQQGDGGSRYRIPVPEAKPVARRRKQAETQAA